MNEQEKQECYDAVEWAWRGLLKLALFILAIGLFIEYAKADGGLMLVWDTPTTREEGSQLDPSDIKGYQIYAKTSEQYELLSEVGNVNEHPLTISYGCVKMATIDIAGLTSVFSKEKCFNPPSPPENFEWELRLRWITPNSNL